jgi:hypothetical protein
MEPCCSRIFRREPEADRTRRRSLKETTRQIEAVKKRRQKKTEERKQERLGKVRHVLQFPFGNFNLKREKFRIK